MTVGNTTGVKYDKDKPRPGLVLDLMPRAIMGVAQVATFGARKYTDDNFLRVPDATKRYRDAQLRHELMKAMGQEIDPESGYPHDFHIAWNILARLEVELREKEQNV